MAAAAAMAGLIRWVRPPRPWRPSKLRFEVEAQRSPGVQLVGVHGQAHRAARLAPVEAGLEEDAVEALVLGLLLHQARSPARPWRARRRPPCGPRAIAAAARRSSMRLLVQEPMKTLSTVMSVERRAGRAGPCSRARAAARRAASRRRRSSGSGTVPVIGSTSSGLVPQVTCGAMSRGVERDLAVEVRARRRTAASASRRRPAPSAALAAPSAGP